MWAGLRVEISCFSTTSTDALNMVGPAGQPVIYGTAKVRGNFLRHRVTEGTALAGGIDVGGGP